MKQTAGLFQAQQQRLTLTPQMLQSISLMAMPVMDLREYIFEEVEKNPALEIVGESQDAPIPIAGGTGRSGSEASDEFQAFIESRPDREQSLQEHLLSQLAEIPMEKSLAVLCQKIIQNLDSQGFHAVPPQLLFFDYNPQKINDESVLPDLTAEQQALLEQALAVVRSLDPQGTACTDVREALIYQALQYPDFPPLALNILSNHFELLANPRISSMVKKIPGATANQIEEALNAIRNLEPLPARGFQTTVSGFIAPDVYVHRLSPEEAENENLEGELFKITIDGTLLPTVAVSPLFDELASEKTQDAKTKTFVQEKLRDAQWFINSLAQRSQSLARVSQFLVHYQQDFFLYGPRYLKPLRLKDVAQELNLHETTISRIASGKYLQCAWGLFEIKYFFSSSVPTTAAPAASVAADKKEKSGSSPVAVPSSNASKESVKLLLKEIIAENPGKLSDTKLSELLAQRGITLARRTVAKYRGELDILSSYDR